MAVFRLAAGSAALLACLQARAQCLPAWTLPPENFSVGGNANLDLVVADPDGDGPLGLSVIAASTYGITRWNGVSWTSLASPYSFTSSCDLVVFDDDGPGPHPPSLYAGGDFGVLRCLGSSWTRVGSAVTSGVYSLIVHDEDGPGPGLPRLVAGGAFPLPGSPNRRGIAAFSGADWVPLGTGLPNLAGRAIYSLASYSLAGPEDLPVLVAAGRFTEIGGVSAADLAVWNGDRWAALPPGDLRNPSRLAVLGAETLGLEPQLVALGELAPDGGPARHTVSRWTGSGFAPVGGAFDRPVWSVRAIDVDDDGPAPARLFAAGTFSLCDGRAANRIAVLRDGVWVGLPGDFTANNIANVYSVDPDGDGPRPSTVHACGEIRLIDGWDDSGQSLVLAGDRWTAAWTGFSSPPYVFFPYDPDGPGPQPPVLLAGGAFHYAPGAVPARGLAAWDGARWSAFAGGIEMPAQLDGASVDCMVMHDPDGEGPLGPQLHIGGDFASVGGVAAAALARYDGQQWRPLGVLARGPVIHALASFDQDGPGPMPAVLYAGGRFNSLGGAAAGNVARWNGESWSPLLAGVSNVVWSFSIFDRDGAGPGRPWLIIGGEFSSANNEINLGYGVAIWDGAAFLQMTGPGPTTASLAVWDPDGAGTRYAPQVFAAGGQSAGFSRALNGRSFVPQTSLQISYADGLIPFDPDGSGPAAEQLYLEVVSGAARSLYAWDGARALLVSPSHGALGAVFDDDAEGPLPPALYAAGDFLGRSPARFGLPAPPVIARHPAPLARPEGADVRFQAWAEGASGLTYAWFRDGQPLAADDRTLGVDTPTLTIRGVQRSDSGSYACRVSNACTFALTRDAPLRVLCRGDLNLDGVLDAADLARFVGDFQAAGPAADFNADGFIDFFDYEQFLAALEAGC